MAVAGKGSAITHGHEISRACCFIWTEFLKVISQGFILDAAVRYIEHIPYFELFSPETVRELSWLADQRMHELTGDDIDETGYVVDTLYTALYSLLHAQDYETSIRNAVNLGYDTDTAAAVTGTAAGMLYGVEGIPERWLEKLKKRKYLESMAKEFAESFADQ